MTLHFHVGGTPAPKGSMRAIPFRMGDRLRVSVKHDNPRTKPWLAQVTSEARVAMEGAAPVDEPVEVTLGFTLPRPKGHFGAKGLLKSAPARPASKPDLDKLVRCVLDAMNGVVWVDDGRVVKVTAWKRYGLMAHGVTVEVQLADEALRMLGMSEGANR